MDVRPKYEYKSMKFTGWKVEEIGDWFNELAKDGWEPMFSHPTLGTLNIFRREIG